MTNSKATTFNPADGFRSISVCTNMQLSTDYNAAIARILARGVRRLLERAPDSPQVSALSENWLSTPCLPPHGERVSTGFGTTSRGQED